VTLHVFTTCVLTVIVGVSKLCKKLGMSCIVNNVAWSVTAAFRSAS